MIGNYQINAIATRVLVDPDFCDAILNGQRREQLREFNLSEEMTDAIMDIDGNNIHNFIHQLYLMMNSAPNLDGSLVPITRQRPFRSIFNSSQLQNIAIPA